MPIKDKNYLLYAETFQLQVYLEISDDVPDLRCSWRESIFEDEFC